MVYAKICGITNILDYKAAITLGTDFTGFIFYKRSPRFVQPEKVKKIISSFYKPALGTVGVFVNEDIETIRDIYRTTGIDIVQLHGDETPDYCKKLGLPYWKAIRVKDSSSLDVITNYSTDTILLDTFSEKIYGGTGRSFDIEIAKAALISGKKFMVAGGVSIENIDDVISLKPYGVDINSSIEKSPGIKDHSKMQKILSKIQMVKGD